MSNFKMKYEIVPRYLSGPSKRRPCIPMQSVIFMVAHDTGNPGSTASGNVGYYENSRNDMEASAQIFVDDKQIIECIPFLTDAPEKAWHVIYNVTTDNQRYGADANDAAGGVELCYGGNVNLTEAYKRYVWVLAYSCWKYALDPAQAITGHHILDPKRKTDPMNALKLLGKTFDNLIADVVLEYNECMEEDDMSKEIEELKGKFQTLLNTADVHIKKINDLEAKASMSVPDWAKDAVTSAVSKGLIDTPEGRSYDFYSLLAVFHRKGLI
ncbi:N-acetylmuramoyl-L-alanine amidase [Paenibacillus alba]|uniref:peptidoglycan recognition protein family protein n=1 Tax=Paenibacillus alba TaxID=1197127 RepID=UPI0015663738|nr:peptidoglycan recognition family protein [Paenibacillus alba]NQX68501.1 N-acetylmuramoyl-L-alanine amidase [Paenibacillus alba]